MDSGSQYKLKISIDNTNSDDEDSDSGSDDLKHNRRPKTFAENQSGDDVSKDRESDNDERTLSVALDTDRPTVSEQVSCDMCLYSSLPVIIISQNGSRVGRLGRRTCENHTSEVRVLCFLLVSRNSSGDDGGSPGHVQ